MLEYFYVVLSVSTQLMLLYMYTAISHTVHSLLSVTSVSVSLRNQTVCLCSYSLPRLIDASYDRRQVHFLNPYLYTDYNMSSLCTPFLIITYFQMNLILVVSVYSIGFILSVDFRIFGNFFSLVEVYDY